MAPSSSTSSSSDQQVAAQPSSSSSVMNSISKQRYVLVFFLVAFGFFYAASWDAAASGGSRNGYKSTSSEDEDNNNNHAKKFLSKIGHSQRHQSRFMARKDQLAFHVDVFSCSNTSSSSSSSSSDSEEGEDWWGGTVLNDEWAYLYKMKQKPDGTADTGSDKRVIIPLAEMQQQRQYRDMNWIVVVQDPIDHFLTGYSQVYTQKYSHFPESRITKFAPDTYTHKVLQYLKQVKTTLAQMKAAQQSLSMSSNKNTNTSDDESMTTTTTTTPTATAAAWDDAYRHSFPQANFILDKNGKVYKSVKLIADLAEVPSILESIMSNDNNDDMNDEDEDDEDTAPAAATTTKTKHRQFLENEAARAANGTVLQPPTRSYSYFPARRDLLSDYTMREICKFVAIDYYLFDFPLPKACADDGGGVMMDFLKKKKQYR